MANQPTTSGRKHTSERHRLDLLEEIVTGIVSYDLATGSISVDTSDADWFEDGAHNKEVSNLRKNDPDISWARLTDDGSIDTIDLDAGRYKITFQLVVASTTGDTQAMNLRYALTNDESTQEWLAGVAENGLSEPATPAGLDNLQMWVNHTDFFEVTDATNLLYLQLALAVASQTGVAILSGLSKVIIERLG